jgi:hypothetical protein
MTGYFIHLDGKPDYILCKLKKIGSGESGFFDSDIKEEFGQYTFNLG